MRFNIFQKRPDVTHEGAIALKLSAEQELKRSVMSCLLWEDEFYEDGQTIAQRIENLAAKVAPEFLAKIAIEARTKFKLRHVSLLLLCALVKHGKGNLVSDTINSVILRADELAELLALYFKDKKRPLAKQLKLGLARAFTKFDAYQLAKYNRSNAIKLRDVLFLCHAKPKDEAQAQIWKQLVDNSLPSPDTWEVALSSGANKGESFTRLINEGKLGYLALLRNLRNMQNADVEQEIVQNTIIARKGAQMVLPFRYVAAARAAPMYEPYLDMALQEAILEKPILEGKTIVLVDVSGSMNAKLSAKSDLTRLDAAATLASIIPGNVRVFSFSEITKEVPRRIGMAGVDAIINSQPNYGTYLGAAVTKINTIKHDRLIVITDEQTADQVPEPKAKLTYMINIASNKNGIGYGKWNHIDGFSEAILDYIREYETLNSMVKV